jgi:predicted Zn-dependent peptidase
LEWAVRIDHTVLDSGLSVVTVCLSYFDSATVACVVKTGSRYESETNNGIAHFLEHMAFKGTASRSAADIAAEIELYGSSIDAFTSPSITSYHVTGLVANVPRAVAILGDVMAHSLLREADIETERGVILQEIKLYQDNAQAQAAWAMARTAYPGQPAGRQVIGTAETVTAARRDDFVAFLRAHYHAANMVVIGAGNLEHEAFVQLVAEHFSDLPRQGARSVPEPAHWVGGYSADSSRPFEQVNLWLGLPSLPQPDPGHHAHRALAVALGQGMSSPLFREVREKRGLVYATFASSEHGHDHGKFSIYAGMTPAHVEPVLETVCGLLANPEVAIGERDVLRAKNALLAHHATEKERPFQLAIHTARRLLNTGTMPDPEHERREIEAVTVQDVHDAARAVIAHRPTLAMVGPVPTGRDHFTLLQSALAA